MDTYLCKYCGKKLDSSIRVCPDCGALNPHNEEVITEATKQVVQEYEATKKFTNGFSVVALIVGIGLFLFHMIMLVSDPPSYLAWELFVGAISGGMVVVLTTIGMVKNEGVGKAVLISAGISLWMLFMFAFISF